MLCCSVGLNTCKIIRHYIPTTVENFNFNIYTSVCILAIVCMFSNNDTIILHLSCSVIRVILQANYC